MYVRRIALAASASTRTGPAGARARRRRRTRPSPRMTGSRKSFGCGLVKRIRSIPSTASTARSSSPNSVRSAGARSRPQRVDVLAEQGHLADALGGEPLDLGDDVARPAAPLAAPDCRHDAVRADGVAPHRDLNPGLEAPLAAASGDRPRTIAPAGRRSSRAAACPAGAEPLAEMRDRAGAEGDVDEGIELEETAPLSLRVAAADGNDALRITRP